MEPSHSVQPSVLRSAWRRWNDVAAREGQITASRMLVAAICEFLRDSTPARRRQRYGDVDFDWEHRVNTTSAAVPWRERLLGVFHSAYQPTDPALFHEMLDALQRLAPTGAAKGWRHPERSRFSGGAKDLPLNCPRAQAQQHRHARSELSDLRDFNFSDFTFIDLGSGKGRALLMASDHPFRRIVGVELLPTLHQIAQENLNKYRSQSQRCFALESICADATHFHFPAEPTVLYLFNPFPQSALQKVLANLEQSLSNHPRTAYVLYHNPALEPALLNCTPLRKIGGTHQYSLYEAVVAR